MSKKQRKKVYPKLYLFKENKRIQLICNRKKLSKNKELISKLDRIKNVVDVEFLELGINDGIE